MRALLDELGMTQTEFAAELEVGKHLISRYCQHGLPARMNRRNRRVIMEKFAAVKKKQRRPLNSDTLRAILQARNMIPAQLADEVGLSRSSMARYLMYGVPDGRSDTVEARRKLRAMADKL